MYQAGANSSFYKSHFINIKLRLITNQLRKNLKFTIGKDICIDCRRHTFIVMYLLHHVYFVSSRRRGWMTLFLVGCWAMSLVCFYSLTSLSRIVWGSLFLDELVHVMLGTVLRGGHLEHVGGAEERLLRVPVGDHLQSNIIIHFSKSQEFLVSLPQIMTFLFSGRGIIEQSHRAATAIPAFSIRTKHILKIRSGKCHELFEREIANLRYSANAYYLPLSY